MSELEEQVVFEAYQMKDGYENIKRELMRIFEVKGKEEKTGWMSRGEEKEVWGEKGHWARNYGKKGNREQGCFHCYRMVHLAR